MDGQQPQGECDGFQGSARVGRAQLRRGFLHCCASLVFHWLPNLLNTSLSANDISTDHCPSAKCRFVSHNTKLSLDFLASPLPLLHPPLPLHPLGECSCEKQECHSHGEAGHLQGGSLAFVLPAFRNGTGTLSFRRSSCHSLQRQCSRFMMVTAQRPFVPTRPQFSWAQGQLGEAPQSPLD